MAANKPSLPLSIVATSLGLRIVISYDSYILFLEYFLGNFLHFISIKHTHVPLQPKSLLIWAEKMLVLFELVLIDLHYNFQAYNLGYIKGLLNDHLHLCLSL